VNRPSLEEAEDLEDTPHDGPCRQLEAHPSPVPGSEAPTVIEHVQDRAVDERGFGQVDVNAGALVEQGSEGVPYLFRGRDVVFAEERDHGDAASRISDQDLWFVTPARKFGHLRAP
jgi:hypothetical protein